MDSSVAREGSEVKEWRPAVSIESTEARARAHPIQVAWAELARHADGCEPCAEVVPLLRGVPADPRAADAELYPRLCVDGRELHGAWVVAKTEAFEAAKPGRARMGVLGASQAAVELRDAAWASLTDPERRRYLALPEAERFRLLEALEAGLQRRAIAPASAVSRERAVVAEGTDVRERPWQRPGGGRRRRLLEETE